MLFNSLEFVVFFVVVLALYSVLNHSRQNALLLAASYLFYGAWDYRFLALLIGTTVVDYAVALAIDRRSDPLARRRILMFSIVANLGVLGIFKYFNFFADSLVDFAGLFGLTVSPVTLNIVLPVGVSFYTFQSMAYTIDVYRGHLKPCRRLPDFALYVTFFPQLVAGPIERATHLLPQVYARRIVTADKIGAGLSLIALGFFKKVVMADNLAPTVNEIFAKQGGFTAEEVLAGVLCFAFQIYGDFSGYTDIARGTSRLLGFELMDNFREPYFARNPSDFWQRWHISLSSWLRDYLYISLGGNRGGRLATYRNLMLTMLLGGLWHGAAWNFVWWGLYHGALLVGYRFYEERAGARSTAARSWLGGVLQIAVMFGFTLYGWLLFRATSGAQIVEMTLALGHFESLRYLARELVTLAFFAWPVVLLDYLRFRGGYPETALLRAPMAVQALTYAGFMLMFFVMGRYEGASFIYFQF